MIQRERCLVAAVVEESIGRIADASEAAVAAVDAGADAADQLEHLLRLILERARVDRAVKQAAAALGADVPHVPGDSPDDVPRDSPDDDSDARRALVAVGRLLAAAHHDRRVRDDLTIGDLLLVVEAAPDTTDHERIERYLHIVLGGIRR